MQTVTDLFLQKLRQSHIIAASAEMTVRMSPIMPDSFAEIRARRRLGIAIAAMMPMIATTISSSIRVKPF